MLLVKRESSVVQLSLIPGVRECLQVSIQPMEAAGETAAATHQACQVVAQLGIIPFN